MAVGFFMQESVHSPWLGNFLYRSLRCAEPGLTPILQLATHQLPDWPWFVVYFRTLSVPAARWPANDKPKMTWRGTRNVSVRTADFPAIGYSTSRQRVLTVTQTCSVIAWAVDVIAQGLPSPVHTYLLQEVLPATSLQRSRMDPKRLIHNRTNNQLDATIPIY